MSKIEDLAKQYAEDMCPVGDYCGGVYDEQRNSDLSIYTDDAKSVLSWLFAKPLASRLTAEEKDRVRKMYEGELEFAQFYQRKANSCINQQCRMDYEASRDIAKSRADMLESIFGKDFFKEGE
jgi:hypothetical protein